MLAALACCPAVPVRAGLSELTLPSHPSSDPAFVPTVVSTVVDALAGAGTPVALVLDDVHEITAPEPLRGLATLVRHRPTALHVVLSGRMDPPLHLARLRLAGELHEVRARDLRFTVAEAALVLAQAGVEVRPDQVQRLVEQTEGWPAGLRLAAMSLTSLRTREATDEFIADFAANDRAVAEYLVGEILDHLPADVCDLLRAVSVCDQLTGELAAALAARPDAADMLGALERQTSLVLGVGGDRASYRVHPLLRAHLRADLERRHPERLAALHARASQWNLDAGRTAPALAHAAEAGDPGRHLDLLVALALTLVGRGQHAVVRRHLRRAPPADPRTALVAALLAVEDGDPDLAGLHLTRAGEGGPGPAEGADGRAGLAAAVRSRRIAGGGRHAVLRVSAELAVDASRDASGATPSLLLDLAVALRARGRTGHSREVAHAALRQARDAGLGLLVARALLVHADLAADCGEHRELVGFAGLAAGELAAVDHDSPADLMHAHALLALAAVLRGEPEEALRAAAPAGRWAGDAAAAGDARAPFPAEPLLLAARGTALLDLGRESAGLEDLRGAHTLATRCAAAAVAPSRLAAVAVLVHGGAVATEHHQLARTLLTWAEDAVGGTPELRLLQARQQVLRGRHGDADRGGLVDGCAPSSWTAVEAAVLACRLALLGERRTTARDALAAGLAAAARTQVLRPLVVAPAEVVDLLVRGLGGHGTLEPVAVRALELRSGLVRRAAPVHLTDRERAVLRLLPTQRSIHEIAEDLTVSDSTVKTHVRAIYGKLGVSSRRDAVAIAHHRGVL